MVQAGRTGGADVHAGTLAHRFQAFQDLDLGAAVGVIGGRLAVGFGDDFFCHEVIASCLGEGSESIVYNVVVSLGWPLPFGLFGAFFQRRGGQLAQIQRFVGEVGEDEAAGQRAGGAQVHHGALRLGRLKEGLGAAGCPRRLQVEHTQHIPGVQHKILSGMKIHGTTLFSPTFFAKKVGKETPTE